MKTNTQLNDLIHELKKQAIGEDVKLWKRIATDLEKSTRSRPVVNLSKIDYLTKEDEIVIVPGKVLGNGELSHKVTVAALNFSSQAVEKIKKSNGQVSTIMDLMKNNPKAKKVRILG